MEGIWGHLKDSAWMCLPNNRWIYCYDRRLPNINNHWPVGVRFKRLGPKQLTEWEE